MSENKTGKYFKYAIGEIILVVIGILIALQINNWNNDRTDSLKEHAILKELHKEFLGNKSQFDSVKKVHYRSMESLKTIMDSMPLTKEKIYSMVKLLDYATNTFTYNPSNGVVNSLINSGNYELIKNDSLRSYLITWNDVYQDFLEEELNHQKFRYDVMDPLLAENTDLVMFKKGDQEAMEFTLNYITSSRFRSQIDILQDRLTNVITDLEAGIVDNHIAEIIRLTKTDD